MDTSMAMTKPMTVGEVRLAYQEQDAALTLREGLDIYYAANTGLFDTSQASSETLGTYLKNHDVTHVVFGTTTAMADEMLQDMWTFLAVDVSKKAYVFDFLGTDESKVIMKSLKPWETLKVMVMALPAWGKIVVRSRQMTKKWPWTGWEGYLDMPLGEIRRAFNLQVL